MQYTLGTAAKAAGVGKATISRAIASGKLSAERQPGGSYAIDASELRRVFPPTPALEQVLERTDSHETPRRNGADPAPLAEFLARVRDQLLATIADLRERLTESEKERRATAERLTALLSDSRSTEERSHRATDPAPTPIRRWWRFGQ